MTQKALGAMALALLLGTAALIAFLLTGHEKGSIRPELPMAPESDPFAPLTGVPDPPAFCSPSDGTRAGLPSPGPASDPVPDPENDNPSPDGTTGTKGPEAPPDRPSGNQDGSQTVTPRGLAVVEATLCRKVDRATRKPVGSATTFRVQDGRIWCFMKLEGGAHRNVRTVWHLGGRRHYGVWMKAGAPGIATWRTWAYKNIDVTSVGEGRVEIVDENDTVLLALPVHILL